jgi:hypothetical protein
MRDVDKKTKARQSAFTKIAPYGERFCNRRRMLKGGPFNPHMTRTSRCIALSQLLTGRGQSH